MADMEMLHNKVLYLMTQSEKCIKDATQNKIFLKLLEKDEMSLFTANKFIDWYREFQTLPSRRKIYEKCQGSELAARVYVKLKNVNDIGESVDPPTENEFGAYIKDLKTSWMQDKFTENLNRYEEIVAGKTDSTDDLSKKIKSFGNEFLKISDAVMTDDEGEYSFTTEDIVSNIEKITNRDTSKEKRFKIGHRILDNETNGFRYGEFIIVLGNVNQGKSMVVSNITYNLWKNKANVLLLTAEHKASEFDERIYSRATSINYKSIMDGGIALDDKDRDALKACAQAMSGSENRIITKFLKNSDNVGTIAGYIEDLRLKRNFVPDVVLLDSLEKISPLEPIIEDKDNLKVAQVAKEFKQFAQTAISNRGVVVISTHQAKTLTLDKKFEDIGCGDFGRSKVVAEEPDFGIYIRTKKEFNTMNVKLVKARRTAGELTWNMATDFSKALVSDTEDKSNSDMLLDD